MILLTFTAFIFLKETHSSGAAASSSTCEELSTSTVYYTAAAEAASSSVYDSLAANKSSSQRLLIFGICQQLRFWVQKPAAATAELSKTKLLLGPPYPINSNCVIGCLFGKRAVVERTLFQKSSNRAIFSQEKRFPPPPQLLPLFPKGLKDKLALALIFYKY